MRDIVAQLSDAGPDADQLGLQGASIATAVEDLAQLAALTCAMPMAVVSLQSGGSEPTLRGYGVTRAQAEQALELCVWQLGEVDGLTVVPDGWADERFGQNDLFASSPRMRAVVYLPLLSPNGATLGRMCLFDRVVRTLTAGQTDALQRLARLAAYHLGVRESAVRLESRLARMRGVRRDLTERAKYYQRIFETAQGFVWWHRPDGTLSMVNDGVCHALGYDRDELTGRNLRDLVPAEHHVAFDRYLEMVSRSGAFRGLLTLQAADGRKFALAYQTSTFELPEGARVMGHGVDISDRVRIEAFNRRLAKVLEATPDFVGCFDPSGQPTYLNRAAREMCGIDRHKDATTVALSNLCGSEAAVCSFQAALAQAAEYGPYTRETIIRDRAGRATPVSQLVVAHRSPDGAVEFYAVLARDISQRIKDEQSMLAGERRFRRVVESLQEVLFETDPCGFWTYLNPAWTDITGFSIAETLSRPMAEFILADDADGYQQQVDALLRRERQVSIEQARCRTHDGDLRWVEVSARPMLDDDGTVMGTTGTLRDITEQRELSEALMKASQEALAASRLKSEFVANMSHEVRTPINGVIGLTSLLLDTPLTLEQRDYAEGVKQSAEALLAIVNDVLDLSKIEAGKLTIEPVTFDLRRTIGLALEPVAVKARHKGLTLRTECAADVPECIVSDPTRLRQLLINLTDNAVKFTHDGAVVVDVRRVAIEGGGERLRFAVSDSGIGIPEAKLGAIFEKFTQADSSTTRKYGGTGLGLAICRQLVELMGGQIGVESVADQGSTFWFLLPLLAAEKPASAEAASDRGHTVHSGVRVLVAEDNAINQKVARKFLEKLGCVVEFADNGVEAVARVRDQQFDVVFMDCQMPEMDGYEATRQIRQVLHRSGLPIVAMTAHAMRGDREKCLEAGMSDYLSKPIQREALAAVLARWTTAPGSAHQETAA